MAPRRFVYPTWEDPANIAGGALCVSGDRPSMERLFWILVRHASAEALYKDPVLGHALVNGISLSTKASSSRACTVKIWLASPRYEGDDLDTMLRRDLQTGPAPHILSRTPYFVHYRRVRAKGAAYTKRAVRQEYTTEQRRQDHEKKRRATRRGRGRGRGRQRHRGRGRHWSGRGRGGGSSSAWRRA